MPDYRNLYFTAMHEIERAINVLIAAQQMCEEIYLCNCEEEDGKSTCADDDETENSPS